MASYYHVSQASYEAAREELGGRPVTAEEIARSMVEEASRSGASACKWQRIKMDCSRYLGKPDACALRADAAGKVHISRHPNDCGSPVYGAICELIY